MNDPYKITDQQSRRDQAPSVLNILLWTAMAVLVGLNASLSLLGYTVISVLFGASALACLTVILVRHFRSRK